MIADHQCWPFKAKIFFADNQRLWVVQPEKEPDDDLKPCVQGGLGNTQASNFKMDQKFFNGLVKLRTRTKEEAHLYRQDKNGKL